MEKIINHLAYISFATVFTFFLSACGDSGNDEAANFNKTKTVTTNPNGLTDFEMENGIGPVKQKLELGAIDPALVKKGETIFTQKCASCHKLDEKYVGPAQRDVIKRRTPEYIINMMTNPEEMYKKHPEAKKLLTQYLTQMPNQNLTFDEARAVLEYFREVGK